ncbi:hypothetical protein BKA66DRAFT_444924 [Pyrenochaeta sp. MPI-SDFR-AT-0127]|nr:hypothetical protein BKA66DRAFT_444924 [Pyrenochaeta sp. MPI-SDFR-AT-0127]
MTDVLRPDYRLPASKVFIDVTREIATNTGSTPVFSLVDHDSKEIPGLPSWFPDYSGSNVHALACICHTRLYCAFNLVPYSPEPTIVENEFFLCAMRWGTMTYTELTGRPFVLEGQMDLCLQLPEIYSNGQTRVDALWRTLIRDADGEQSPAPADIGNSFHQYVLLAIAVRVRKILKGWVVGRELKLSKFDSLIKLNNNYDECPNPWLPGGD